MLRIIRVLIAFLVGMFSSKAKGKSTPLQVSKPIVLHAPKRIIKAQQKEPVPFDGILVARPSWMSFEVYKRIRKEQQKRIKMYLRNPRYNGYMGNAVCSYNSPKHYAFQ